MKVGKSAEGYLQFTDDDPPPEPRGKFAGYFIVGMVGGLAWGLPLPAPQAIGYMGVTLGAMMLVAGAVMLFLDVASAFRDGVVRRLGLWGAIVVMIACRFRAGHCWTCGHPIELDVKP